MSKKRIYVTQSPEDYAALQAWIASDKANRKKQPHDPPKPKQPAKPQPQGGMDGFTFLIVTAVMIVLALAGLEALGVLS